MPKVPRNLQSFSLQDHRTLEGNKEKTGRKKKAKMEEEWGGKQKAKFDGILRRRERKRDFSLRIFLKEARDLRHQEEEVWRENASHDAETLQEATEKRERGKREERVRKWREKRGVGLLFLSVERRERDGGE